MNSSFRIFLLSCAFRWKAANYSQLYGMTLDEGIRYRLGTQRPSRTIMNMNEIQVQDSLYPWKLFLGLKEKSAAG